MIRNKTVLAIIPARGGSKGVVRKNIRQLGKKPLIAWTIEAAMGSNYIDMLILSSEDGLQRARQTLINQGANLPVWPNLEQLGLAGDARQTGA